MHREVEQHHDASLDFVPVDPLGHLVGPVGFPPELISRMRPLFIGLDLPKGEIHRHYNSIQLLVIIKVRSSLTCSIPLELGLSDHLVLLTGT